MIGANKYEYICNHSADVKMMKLDDLVNRSKIIPSALNIDIEGSELECIKGGIKTLKKYHPKIWLSIHPDLMQKHHKQKPSELMHVLSSLGYVGDHLATDHEEHWFFH